MVFTTNAAPRWLLLLVGLLLGAPLLGRAQIVDDSTKVLYGPRTTRVIYEDEVRRDSTRGSLIDTSLVRWSQARFWFHDSTFQQDLGTVGSASRQLLYQPNLQLGARIGRNAFDKYVLDASQVPYYDSRSPYSFFRYIQSSQGEQVFQISYSRSLGKNFSIGAGYERFASNKLLGTNTSEGLVEHNAARFFARYQSENERYRLLVAIVNTRHRAVEQGGIQPLATELYPSDLYKYDREAVYLTGATNTDDRDQLHTFQSYRLLGRGLTAYHILDLQRQYNGYVDGDSRSGIPRVTTTTALYFPGVPVNELLYYPRTLRSRDITADRSTYRQGENTLGFTGHTDRVSYNVYARYRSAWWRANSTVPAGNAPSVGYVASEEVIAHGFAQLFVGGTAAFNYRTIYAVEVAGEYLPYDSNPYTKLPVKAPGITSEYWLRGRIRTGPLSAELLTMAAAPTLTQLEFVGNHYNWNRAAAFGDGNGKTSSDSLSNNFRNTRTTQLTVRLQQRLPLLADHAIDASLALVSISNLVYYSYDASKYASTDLYPDKSINSMSRPEQLSANKSLLIVAARHRFRVGKIFFANQGTYTQGGNGAGLRIPSFVGESRVYYQTHVFKKALLGQVGAEVYYQSDFRAYGYSPSTQQFYVQDGFTIPKYAVASAFVTADIKAATIFLKVAYLNQGLDAGGYFTTPYYTGYPRRLQFGVRWRFFT